MPGGTDLLIGMERTLRDKEVQVSHLMAVVYEEQNRTQDKQDQVLRLDAERLELGRKLAEMESIKRLHVAELEARNRAMTSELDTARMELDNKIREKRELMQAHAAYIEEMERQHANRVDELDTLVQQYRGTIWSYEAKIEGLEKALDGFRDTAAAAAGAHGAPVDLDQFAVTGDETMDVVLGKNEALLQELEATIEERGAAEAARDAGQQEANDLRDQLASAQESLDAASQEALQLRDALSQAGVSAPPTSGGGGAASGGGGAASGAGGAASGAGGAASGGSSSAASGAGGSRGGNSLSSAEEVIAQAAGASSPGNAEDRAHYDDLRKKLLHTCVSLLEEFDDKRCTKAKELIETAENDF